LVVCVGRLSRQKGQDLLLAAWPAVAAEVPDARLALVGGGPDEGDLRAVAPAGVSFVGVSAEVPSWLAAADVIALPSRWEGMSLSMLEAMAAGRSIVSADVPGAREALGAGAGVVPVEDVRALSQALLRRLTDASLRENEERTARRIAEEGDLGPRGRDQP
jgi:glycosyltransferase involved in cell wall biosynthesis